MSVSAAPRPSSTYDVPCCAHVRLGLMLWMSCCTAIRPLTALHVDGICAEPDEHAYAANGQKTLESGLTARFVGSPSGDSESVGESKRLHQYFDSMIAAAGGRPRGRDHLFRPRLNRPRLGSSRRPMYALMQPVAA